MSDVTPVSSLHLEIPDAPLPWEDNRDSIRNASVPRSDLQEGMTIIRPGALDFLRPLSNSYLDSAVWTLAPRHVISSKANDNIGNIIINNAVVVNNDDNDELVDPQEHESDAREEILAKELTSIMSAEPIDPYHSGCQVLFQNPCMRVFVDFLVIFLVTITGSVKGIISSVSPEDGNDVVEGLYGEMSL